MLLHLSFFFLIENVFLLDALIKPLVLSPSLIYLHEPLVLTLAWKFILPQHERTWLFPAITQICVSARLKQLRAASVQPVICLINTRLGAGFSLPRLPFLGFSGVFLGGDVPGFGALGWIAGRYIGVL